MIEKTSTLSKRSQKMAKGNKLCRPYGRHHSRPLPTPWAVISTVYICETSTSGNRTRVHPMWLPGIVVRILVALNQLDRPAVSWKIFLGEWLMQLRCATWVCLEGGHLGWRWWNGMEWKWKAERGKWLLSTLIIPTLWFDRTEIWSRTVERTGRTMWTKPCPATSDDQV